MIIPIKERFIYGHASIFHKQAFFIFGGYGDFGSAFGSEMIGFDRTKLHSIGRLDAVTRTWSLAGKLKQSKGGHSVIFNGSQFLVIGGVEWNDKTENCTPNGTKVTCVESPGYSWYGTSPELMLVGGDFANDCFTKLYEAAVTKTPLNATTLRQPGAQNKTVLVLNSLSEHSWKPALLIDSTGRQEELDCFSYGDNTISYKSCSLVWKNHLYVYGGDSTFDETYDRQISRLNQYRLQRIGYLPFNFRAGTCTNMADRKFFLCFHSFTTGLRQCHWSINPLGDFQNITLTSYNHYRAKISSSECEFFYHLKSYEDS